MPTANPRVQTPKKFAHIHTTQTQDFANVHFASVFFAHVFVVVSQILKIVLKIALKIANFNVNVFFAHRNQLERGHIRSKYASSQSKM